MKYNNIIFFLLGVFLISSCSKDRIEPPKNEYESINSYFKSKQVKEQEFVITKKENSPIKGNQGSLVWISKNMLQMPDGSEVLYPYTVKLIEIYKAKDMMYYQMSSIVNQTPMQTVGEFKITACKDAQELSLKKDTFFYLECLSNNPKEGMKVFYGTENNSQISWTDNLTDFGTPNLSSRYFHLTATTYKGAIGKMGWVTGDSIVSAPYVTLNFTSQVDVLDNVAIFVYDAQKNVLIQIHQLHSSIIPKNTNLEMIAIAVNDKEELYYQYQEFNTSSNRTIDIALQLIKDEDLTSVLDSL